MHDENQSVPRHLHEDNVLRITLGPLSARSGEIDLAAPEILDADDAAAAPYKYLDARTSFVLCCQVRQITDITDGASAPGDVFSGTDGRSNQPQAGNYAQEQRREAHEKAFCKRVLLSLRSHEAPTTNALNNSIFLTDFQGTDFYRGEKGIGEGACHVRRKEGTKTMSLRSPGPSEVR